MVSIPIRAINLAMFLTIFEWIVFVIWVVFWSYWFILAYRTRSPVKRQQSYMSPLLPITTVVLWILVSLTVPGLPFLRIVPAGTLTGLVGIAVTLAGLGFAIWARLHLGINWSGQPMIRIDHKLVRSGPYNIVRNPIYTGILIAMAGTTIVVGEFWAMAVTVILLLAFLMKIRMEEKILQEEFGESFIQYKKEIKSLIPFVL
jgi:protein-S-isoprenylcysteine O-methyltransferase Ste14